LAYFTSTHTAFRVSDSSASTLSRGVDQRVAEHHFSSAAAKTNEADRSNVVGGGIRYNPPSSVFRSAVGVNLIYLTVQQYVLFNSVRKAMIRAPAGAGKTLLILLQVLNLVVQNVADLIFVLAPRPHHRRCLNFFCDNKNDLISDPS